MKSAVAPSCEGYRIDTVYGYDYDCGYEFAGEISCEDCIFGACNGKLDPRKPRDKQL